MKKVILAFLMLYCTGVFAQQEKSRCLTPIPSITFQQLLRNVQSQNQPAARFSEARNAAQNNCLSSAQVKQMASLFENDADRLEFCKVAWVNTCDKENFYDVYDVFAYFSTVFRLHDFVNHGDKKSPEKNPPPPPPTPVDPYKNISFPDYRLYNGNKGCSLPLADTDFEMVLREAKKLRTDAERTNSFVSLSQNNCLTAAQLMKMALALDMEAARLNLLKVAYARCYDQGNYLKMIQVFQHQPNQDELIAFYNQQNKPKNDEPPPPPPCSVSDADMASIKNTLSKQYVESTKVGTIKQILRSKKCFTVQQVKTIIKTISVESYKIDLAKYAYEFTIDTQNYFEVADVFRVESYKRELSEFLENKQH